MEREDERPGIAGLGLREDDGPETGVEAIRGMGGSRYGELNSVAGNEGEGRGDAASVRLREEGDRAYGRAVK